MSSKNLICVFAALGCGTSHRLPARDAQVFTDVAQDVTNDGSTPHGDASGSDAIPDAGMQQVADTGLGFWHPLQTAGGGPTARMSHSAVWTGSE